MVYCYDTSIMYNIIKSYLVLLCLELPIWKLYVGAEYISCITARELQETSMNDPQLVLLESENKTYNEMFIDHVRSSGVYVNVICSGGVGETITAAQMFPNTIIVNLYVNDFYKFNYNYIMDNNLLYAGDVDDVVETVTSITCVEQNNTKPHNCRPKEVQERTQDQHYVKLVSDAVKENIMLQDYINKFPYGAITSVKNIDKEVKTVLVCTDQLFNYDNYNNQFADLSIRNVDKTSCRREVEELQYELLAIVAADPFESHDEISIPVVFYRTPYVRGPFTNALSLMASWEPLKFAFLSFLSKMQWHRVAMISDNWPFNEEVQNGLAAFFHDNGIVFTAKQCKVFHGATPSHVRCDCREALESLKDNDARIIIANVDETNSRDFADQVADARLTTSYRIRWLMIQQPFVAEMSKTMGDIIAISSSPKMEDKANIAETNQILAGIKIITEAYESVWRYTNKGHRSLKEYQSAFTKALIDKTKHTGVTAYVSTISGDSTRDIGSVDIENDIVLDNYHSLPEYSSDMASCVVRSNSFTSPCNEKELYLLMTIAVVFMCTFLAVTVYFSEINSAVFRRRGRYRNMA